MISAAFILDSWKTKNNRDDDDDNLVCVELPWDAMIDSKEHQL